MPPKNWNSPFRNGKGGRRNIPPIKLSEAVNDYAPQAKTVEQRVNGVLKDLKFGPHDHDGGVRYVDNRTGQSAVLYTEVLCCVEASRPRRIVWSEGRILELNGVTRVREDDVQEGATDVTDILGSAVRLPAARLMPHLKVSHAWADPTNLCLIIPRGEVPQQGEFPALVIVRERPREKSNCT